MVQLSHPYMITEKTIALTRWTFVHKVMSLLFNTLSRFVMAFLPRSKHLAAVMVSWIILVNCNKDGVEGLATGIAKCLTKQPDE